VKYILQDTNVGVLAEFARSRTLVAFDFDGTLAPIVSDRNEARMRPATAALLLEVCELFPTAVISGRARTDLFDRLPRLGVKHVIGNHGIEPCLDMQSLAREVRALRSELTMRLLPHTQVDIEDKVYSLSLHYRNASSQRDARAAILRACARLRGKARVVPGKCVVNVLPRGAPDKGRALEELCAREQASATIYVGDDVTDEDAFALAASSEVLAIRVGPDPASAAPFFVRDQDEVDVLLARLIALRA
jgi:trehalose 6-phosphate phosphatase